jgi:hypothetical protein
MYDTKGQLVSHPTFGVGVILGDDYQSYSFPNRNVFFPSMGELLVHRTFLTPISDSIKLRAEIKRRSKVNAAHDSALREVAAAAKRKDYKDRIMDHAKQNPDQICFYACWVGSESKGNKCICRCGGTFHGIGFNPNTGEEY